MLTLYPLNMGVYDQAIDKGYFKAKKNTSHQPTLFKDSLPQVRNTTIMKRVYQTKTILLFALITVCLIMPGCQMQIKPIRYIDVQDLDDLYKIIRVTTQEDIDEIETILRRKSEAFCKVRFEYRITLVYDTDKYEKESYLINGTCMQGKGGKTFRLPNIELNLKIGEMMKNRCF